MSVSPRFGIEINFSKRQRANTECLYLLFLNRHPSELQANLSSYYS